VEVEIICPIHGPFHQLAATHTTMKHGCPDCGREKQALSQTYTQEDFLRLAHDRHGSRYDYSQAVYKPRIGGEQEPTTIICREHGPFPQRAHDHLQGKGCPDCKMDKLKISRLLTQAEFIERAEKVHGTYYDYSRVEYTGIKDFVEIICPKHGPFPQRAEGHLDGNGCPRCSNSTGEKAIAEFLETYGIEFETEKRFDDCRRIHRLPFDFYLSDFTTLIEFDGAQHFIPAGWFSTKERALKNLALVQERDRIKNDWAKEKSIPLFRIRHDEDVKVRMIEILGALSVI
jgi:Zn finger protein HypA/HybF involved in hydrogenase expression